jgi:iron transport multicopper oxidase
VWPGNGGWVYVATSSGVGGNGTLHAYRYGVDGSGRPTLSLAGTTLDPQGSPEGWGFSSTAGVVTSNGLQSGSAILWGVWSSGASGAGAQLRAYSAVPVNGRLQELGRWPAGTASKFALPAVSGNRLYLGNRDGHVISYGSPVNSPVTVSPPRFPLTVVNQHSTSNMVLTATANLTVRGVTSSNGAFVPVAPASPTVLARGQSLTVPVTFGPTTPSLIAATLRIDTSLGPMDVPVDGRGTVRGARLEASPSIVSFGSVPVDPERTPPSQSLSLFNGGSAPITITGVTLPGDAAFQVTGMPPAGTTVSPGDTVTGTVTFSPGRLGSFTDELRVSTDGTADCAEDEENPAPANVCMVALTGVGAQPAHLVISTPPAASAPVGGSDDVSFTLTNTGGSVMTILKSKPPQTGGFAATTLLPEGSRINPGQTLTETVRFSPTVPGTASSSWAITGDDDTGAHTVSFSGTATGTGPPTAQAGPDQRVKYGVGVQLDGSDSTSGDTGAPTYAWSQVGGPTVVLNDATSSRPTFTAPGEDADLTFRLTVRNTAGQTDTDDVVVVVRSK